MLELDEVWILHESGVCLFNYAVEAKMNPVLFGSFFTAINQFGQQCGSNSIDDITMGENFLVSQKIPEYRISIVARSTSTKKRKTMKKILDQIATLFQSQYSAIECAKFNGNIDKFEPFKEFVDYLFNRKAQLVENFRTIF